MTWTDRVLLVSAGLVALVASGGPKVALLDAATPSGGPVRAALVRGGFSVTDVDAAAVEGVASGDFDALAVGGAATATEAVRRTTLDWIRRGRPALVLGVPFAPTPRPPVPTAETPLPKVGRWSFAHGERGAATGRLTETGGVLRLSFSPLQDWSVFTSSKVRVFAPGADTLCFQARAAEPATDVQIELKDSRGGRWFATVRLEPAWTSYALYPEDFAGRPQGARPDFAAVDQIAFALSPHTPRMAGRSADFELRGLGSARDPEPARRRRLPFQDALDPHWKLADAGTYWTPVPRASGQGVFRGLRWRLIGTGEPEWTFLERPVGAPSRAFVASGWKSERQRLDAAALDRAVARLKSLLVGPTLFAAGSRQLAYWPGETMTLGAEWHGGSGGGRVRQEVTDPDGRVVWHGESEIRAGGTNAWSRSWVAPAQPGVYRIRTTCNGETIDQDLTVMSDKADLPSRFVTVSNGLFWAEGRVWHPIGVNYVPRYSAGLNPEDYRDAWMNDDFYDPAIVDEDLAHIAAMGGTFVAIQAPALGSTRNLADFLRRARQHGLRVNLFMWELFPLGFSESGWRRRVREIGLPNDATVFAYDIAWEYGFKVFDEGQRRGARAKDWADWIADEYGDVAAAERAWGFRVWRDATGGVVGPDQRHLMQDGPWRKAVADYRQFMDDFTSRKWNRARRLIRELDPNHLISCRQGNTVPHDFTFTGLARHLDFIAPEGYMVTDTPHGEDVIAWVTRFAAAASGGKPVLWMEFSHDAWDRVTQTTLPDELQKAARYAMRFYRAGWVSGAAGMTPWWWPGGFRFTECSDYGMVEPTGAERPLAKVFRTAAVLYARDRRPYEPTVWMDFDRDAHPGGYWRAALQEGAAAWRAAREKGQRLGVRLAGEGSDSATGEKRFLRGEFDRLDVRRTGASVCVRAEVGNTGWAAWLPTAAGAGGVSLAVRAKDGRLVARLPLTRRVARFESSGLLEATFPFAVSEGQELVFRLEAAGRGAFGERRNLAL